MKYYYGSSRKEALSNPPIDIKSVEQLEQYRENYTFVMPVDEKFTLVVQYRGDDEATHVDEFDSIEEAVEYAKDDADIAHYQVYNEQGDVVAEDDWDDDEEDEDWDEEDEEEEDY